MRSDWPEPFTEARDLLPSGCVETTPTPAEASIWADAYARAVALWQFDDLRVRVIWVVGGDYQGLTLRTPDGVVVLLRSGRRLTDLARTVWHELRHVYQSQFAVDAWTRDEREVDAEHFVRGMLGP